MPCATALRLSGFHDKTTCHEVQRGATTCLGQKDGVVETRNEGRDGSIALATNGMKNAAMWPLQKDVM